MHHPIVKQTVRLSSTAASADPHPEDPAWVAWQRHVDAGRIGNRPVRSVEQRIRMMKNEIALFGRVKTRELERF